MTLLSVENLRIMDVWTHTTLVEEVNFKSNTRRDAQDDWRER